VPRHAGNRLNLEAEFGGDAKSGLVDPRPNLLLGSAEQTRHVRLAAYVFAGEGKGCVVHDNQTITSEFVNHKGILVETINNFCVTKPQSDLTLGETMTLGDRIKAARVERGLSQAELGRRAGISQQAIMSLESGNTRTSRHLPQLARALDVTVEQLYGEAGDASAGAGAASKLASDQLTAPRVVDFEGLPRDIPVLGQAVGGDDGDFRFNGQIIDYLRRPPGLANARDVFGLYVTGTSMWPKFEEGEPIYVSGSRPPAIGDYVVVELHAPAEGEDHQGFIKRLKKRTPTKIVCEQFNPAQDVEFDREAVKSVFRVIPLAELVGI
jgi:phage repressor protein C with HTH and peptisase S24 domain